MIKALPKRDTDTSLRPQTDVCAVTGIDPPARSEPYLYRCGSVSLSFGVVRDRTPADPWEGVRSVSLKRMFGSWISR